MRITLFRALQGIKIHDDQAAAVVTELETHVESVVNNNIKAVEARLDGVEARLDGMLAMMDGLRAQMQFIGVMIGVVAVLISVVGLGIAAGPIVAKFVR